LLLLLTACSLTASPCEQLYAEICEACPVTGYTETMCTCLDEGDLTPGDYPDGVELTAEEASYECDNFQWSLRFAGDDEQGYCKTNLKSLAAYPSLTCENLGYSDDTDTTYSYYE